jgi:hypothetical protein
MSTQAVIAIINLDNSVRYVDLVNDGDLAGKILAENYNSFTAANAVTSGGVISTLRPALQNTMFHALDWGREKRETITEVDALFVMADVIAGQGENESPVYVFDAREYYDDYTKYKDFYFQKMYGYGHEMGSEFESKQYWKRLNGEGKLVPIEL